VKGISADTPLQGCIWRRHFIEYFNEGDGVNGSDEITYIDIPGSENLTEYKLDVEDVGYYVSFQHTWIDDSHNLHHIQSSNCLGPVLPAPPRLLNLDITGDVFKVGESVFAQSEYTGGQEGASEYWWFQIKNGKRVQLNEPTPYDPSMTSSIVDPRVHVITDDDIGSVLKVKCRPVRIDGYKGEVFTSKASIEIQNS
jgi:hypothetical protein